jgi:hypothetical protein
LDALKPLSSITPDGGGKPREEPSERGEHENDSDGDELTHDQFSAKQ